jgi:hypothetical protein
VSSSLITEVVYPPSDPNDATGTPAPHNEVNTASEVLRYEPDR